MAKKTKLYGGKKKLPLIIKIILEVLVAFIYYYLFIPPINICASTFWMFVIFIIIEVWVISGLSAIVDLTHKDISKLKDVPRLTLIGFLSIVVIILGTIIVNFICSPIFNSKSFANRIVVDETGDFSKDIKEVDFNKVPLLDKSSSEKLGDRIMGQYAEYVSQFTVSNEYTQINYNDEILRVTPIEYASFIKWITNKSGGVGAYITVNSVNGEVKLNKLDKGMKYLKSAYFNKNLYRKLRFNHPFTIFANPKFEIDNEGNPYYIIPTIGYTGITYKTRVTGAVIFDPVTGEDKMYSLDEIPSWVDNVYYANLIIEEVNDWGTYRNGFLNSIFGQKNVVNTTEGYNYLALNDDIYLYTGITSVASDESNLGFILTNLRTGETTFYDEPGAEEYSAMDSAEGQVQQMHYVSTFPLLINLKGKPTYLVSLKDNAGLVKMYGFVDVVDYQKVVVTDAALGIDKAVSNYLNTKNSTNNSDAKTNIITVKSITNVVMDGNTYYYIKDSENNKYYVSIKVSNNLPFINSGDRLNITFYDNEDIKEIIKMN